MEHFKIMHAELEDMQEILDLQYLAYQSEADLSQSEKTPTSISGE